MQTANKLMMLSINVSDMGKSKSFYATKLGLKIASEYRQDDDNWWVTLAFPEGGATLTLARAGVSPESVNAGTLSIYLETPDVDAVHEALSDKELGFNDVQDDLFGPRSGVKWCSAKDPDGNVVYLVQKHEARAPF